MSTLAVSLQGIPTLWPRHRDSVHTGCFAAGYIIPTPWLRHWDSVHSGCFVAGYTHSLAKTLSTLAVSWQDIPTPWSRHWDRLAVSWQGIPTPWSRHRDSVHTGCFVAGYTHSLVKTPRQCPHWLFRGRVYPLPGQDTETVSTLAVSWQGIPTPWLRHCPHWLFRGRVYPLPG